MSETFYIKKTAFDDNTLDLAQREEDSFIIGPGELNGPAGNARDSDLELYGFGSLKWGEGVNQNQYRMMESFACPAKEDNDFLVGTDDPVDYEVGTGSFDTAVHPITPKDEYDLGVGNGITTPVIGQPWYNTTDKTLYTYINEGGTEWRSTMTSSGVLDMSMYNIINVADPRDAYNSFQQYHGGSPAVVYPKDAVNVGWGDLRYVNRTGDSMSGALDMGTNRVENVADPSTGADAMSRNYADTRYINVAGGDTMTGILNMSGNRIENIGAANSGDDAMNRDTSDGRYVAKEISSVVNDTGSVQVQVKNDDNVYGYSTAVGGLQIRQDVSGRDAFITFDEAGSKANFGFNGSTNDLFVGGGVFGGSRHKVWHAGNDGSGSGLDADRLDGYNSTQFLKTTDGYQRSDINYPSQIYTRTYPPFVQTYYYNNLSYGTRPSWANYVLLRFTLFGTCMQDVRWCFGNLGATQAFGGGADDTDQGFQATTTAVSEIWVPYYQTTLVSSCFYGGNCGGYENIRLRVYKIGWHQ